MKYLFTLFLLMNVVAGYAQTAPNFTVTNSDGITKNLYNDYLNQGKVVVIEAFFTTCPPCNTHAPFWQALYQSQLAAHPGKVEFIMLSTLQSDNNAKVATYKNNKGLTMPGVGNDGGSLTALQPYTSGQFGEFFGTPTFILIAPDGQVTFDIHATSPQSTMDLIAQHINLALTETCALQSPYGTPISNVQISATTANMTANIISSGSYTLSNLPQLQNTSYTVSATKTDSNPLDGVSTFDLVLISKHIIGLQPFTEPWQTVAADLNCNGSITTFDIVVGRKLILGFDNELACGTWKFVPEGSNTASNGGCVAFTGVKLGDVTGAYFAPPQSERAAFTLHAPDRLLTAGESFSLQMTATEAISLQSLQMDLELDPNALKINQVSSQQLPGFDATCYNPSSIEKGHLPVLWIDGSKADIRPDVSVLILEMTALRDGKLSDLLRLRADGLPSELYDENAQPVQIDLQWLAPESTAKGIARIYPNPAHNTFEVNYNSAEDMTNSRLQVIDIQGNVILEQSVSISKGENRIQVRPENIAPGLHAVKLNGRSLGSILLLGL